ncbi:chromate transporter [Rhizobium azooxidifex]|uniref:Chromate transporter n=1 Tax=Mycoplana azooxidifex TaxID=1636188 RepID=A0A7W6D847_9HYPH|nr:chromate transporter [Mycoplana azooxidifex]MBB3977709.1 chromate transporter [Mycoplana azooxidifex]
MSDNESEVPTARSIDRVGEGPTIARLVLFCLKVGLMSFGGGLSGWLYREFVQRRGWMTDEDFASSFAFAQMLPGPTITNLTICCCSRFTGSVGVLACCLALLVGPFFAVLGLYTVYGTLSHNPVFQAISDGVVFAAIGMLMIICIRGIRRTIAFPPGLAVIAGTAFCVGVLHWPMLPVVLCFAAISVTLAWRTL